MLRIGLDTVVFNSMTCKLAVFRNSSLSMPPNGVEFGKKDLTGFSDEQINACVNAGIFVESEFDEVGKVHSLIQQADADRSVLSLHLNPTLDCNLRCWYCYESHVRDSIMSPAVLRSVKLWMKREIEANKELRELRIGFFGGEPLIGFNEVIKPLVKYASEICTQHNVSFSSGITTNGTLIEPQMADFFSTYGVGFQITIDGNEDCHDRIRFEKGGRGTFSKIMGNVEMLANRGLPTVLRVNYTNDNADSLSNLISVFANASESFKKTVRIDLQRVWQERTNDKDVADLAVGRIRTDLIDRGYTVLRNDLRKSVRTPCYGDLLHHVLVNYDGNVFGCTARDFKGEDRLGYLTEGGEIMWEPGRREIRESARFAKKVCHTCKIAPLCGGGCRQRALESYTHEGCAFGYTEADKDECVWEILDALASKRLGNEQAVI